MLDRLLGGQNADSVDRCLACLDPLLQADMPRIVVHDDRRDVKVVVESFGTGILVDTQDIPLVREHVVVVVILGDVVDAGGTATPRSGKCVGNGGHRTPISPTVAHENDVPEALRLQARGHVRQHGLVCRPG